MAGSIQLVSLKRVPQGGSARPIDFMGKLLMRKHATGLLAVLLRRERRAKVAESTAMESSWRAWHAVLVVVVTTRGHGMAKNKDATAPKGEI